MVPAPPVGPTSALLAWLGTNETRQSLLACAVSPNGRTETEILSSELVHRSPTGVR